MDCASSPSFYLWYTYLHECLVSTLAACISVNTTWYSRCGMVKTVVLRKQESSNDWENPNHRISWGIYVAHILVSLLTGGSEARQKGKLWLQMNNPPAEKVIPSHARVQWGCRAAPKAPRLISQGCMQQAVSLFLQTKKLSRSLAVFQGMSSPKVKQIDLQTVLHVNPFPGDCYWG